jgi:hypothetical protein
MPPPTMPPTPIAKTGKNPIVGLFINHTKIVNIKNKK